MGGYTFPASFAQERLWFLAQLDPDLPLYNLNVWTRLPDHVDPDRVERAFAQVVARHEALRTALVLDGDALVQRISADVPVRIARTDLTDVPAELREVEFDRIARTDAATPVRLDRAPLWRARLVRMSGAGWRLIHVIHHAVFDGFSAGNFDAELLECEAALAAGRDPVLPDLPIQYADYAVWQRRRYADGELAAQLGYWTRTLADLPVDAGLPTRARRPAQPSFAGAEHRLLLPPALVVGVDRVAREHGASPFMTLLAGFMVLIARYSDRTDVVVGTPVAGRSLPETAPLIGMLTNLLVLRTELAGDPTFAEILARVRTTVLDALEHQDVPFEKVVEALRPDRDLSRSPLYQLGFNMLSGARRGQFSNGTAKMDLDLELVRTDAGIEVWFTYDTGLFDAGWVGRLAANFVAVLAAVTADPGLRLADVPVVSAAERALIAGFGAGPARPVSGTVVDLFDDRADRAPDAVAVIDADAEYTYRCVDERANRVAGRLAAAGIGPGDLVGIRLPRGVDLIAALLGVLKTGAGYLPLDVDHPADRIGFMLRDAGAVLIDDLPDRPHTDPPRRPQPPDLAYTIYTSGSTGRPKGVQIEHRALTNLLTAMGERLGTTDTDVWLNLTTPAFDMSVPELFLPLCHGARLVTADRDQTRDGTALLDLIRRHHVTHVQAVPATWWLLLDAGLDDPTVTALTGAEAVPTELVHALHGRVRTVYNMYGPTETTVWTAMHHLPDHPDRIRIAGPLPNTALHILDPNGHPVPIGVTGELCITGTQLARAYHHQPTLTATHFTPHPNGQRIYHTGDHARWTPTGHLEYLGRTDTQIKLHGHRIELGEIETALTADPRVAQAAVRLDGGRLVGYVVPAGPVPPSAPDLRARLARTLPAYMIPASVVTLDRLPLTPNGKVDRATLPAVAPTTGAGDAHVEPATAGETLVASVWTEVLGIERISVHDNFFDLGGHSLLAARATTRIAAATGVDVPVRLLFSDPTVALLAARVEQLLHDEIGALSDAEAIGLLQGNRR